jgi:hypothetical protein
MHAHVAVFVADVVRQIGRPPGLVLEVGSRNINGSIRGLFGEPYLGVDVVAGAGVDVVADGAVYVPPRAPGCVVCCEVLEHTANARAICRQAFTVLAPEGWLIVTAAGTRRAPHSAVHGGSLLPGEFYRNVTVADLDDWLDPFDRVVISNETARGDIYATARKGRR